MGGQQQAKVVSMAATMLAAECDLSSMVNEDILEVRLLHHQHQQNDTALPLAIMLGYSVHVAILCAARADSQGQSLILSNQCLQA